MTYEIWDKQTPVNGIAAVNIIGTEQMNNSDPFILFSDGVSIIAIESFSTMKAVYGLPGETIEEVSNAYILMNNPYIIKDKQYKAMVVDLIRKRYTTDDEFDLHNSVTDALATGALELPVEYVLYREYVETCKDTAYMEVYGIERT